MKKNLIIIIALLAGSLAYSQPGYQGHRFLILYDFNLTPAAASYNAAGKHGVNFLHQGKLEYAWRRKFDLGLQGSFLKTSLNTEAFANDTRPIKSNALGFGLYAKRFAHDGANLAPRGNYFQFGLGAEYVKIYDENSGNQLHSYVGNFNINCGFGKQSLLYKRVVIDYGLTLSLNSGLFNIVNPAAALDPYGSSTRYNGTEELSKENLKDTGRLQKAATFTSLVSNIVALKIGIGFLP